MKEETKERVHTFEMMNLLPETLKAITDLGFEEPTPIQSQAVELIMSGRDVVGQSRTGTGKTAAFGIPALEQIDPRNYHIQTIVLCPTRELAIQVSEEFKRLLKYRREVQVLPIYGGQPIGRQISALKKGIHVVIATPGRLLDHMKRRTIDISHVSMMILDEADEMLDMGFREDIEAVLRAVQSDRQTILFSATMPPEILKLTKKYQKNPEFLKVIPKELTAPRIEQVYFEVREHNKLEILCRLLDLDDPTLTLVFCNTKRKVDSLTEGLQARGYSAEGLHGDLNQHQRNTVMGKFRKGSIDILVATDVAARGIDVDDIELVINYDLPQDDEYYIHRIGRTARAGKSGKAFTFVVGREIYKLRDIINYTKSSIKQQNIPSLTDVKKARQVDFVKTLELTIDEKANDIKSYAKMVESMMANDYSSLDVASALLYMALHDASAEEIEEVIPSEKYSKRRPQGQRRQDSDEPRGRQSSGQKTRLFLNLGKKDKIRPSDIVGAIAGETNIPGAAIGAIDIKDAFSFVTIPTNMANHVITNMNGKNIRGQAVSIEISNNPQTSQKRKR